MSRSTEIEDVSMDMTSMIDVVFLLIIFFILMPPKEMEGTLESYLPSAGGTPPPPTDDEPPVVFGMKLVSEKVGENEITTVVTFNNQVICDFTTLSIGELNKIYLLGSVEKKDRLKIEHDRDSKQFDPHTSDKVRKLITKMSEAADNAPDVKNTDIMIDASSNVPFKVVLAILNAGAGADFPNLKFAAPSMAIWKAD